ncbi:MAG: Uma2 family endonuclease [Acaryochloris sp. RU_4_1]|nr:Uma2 family endonuclease [Acaryochloris sp. SU_5_25]NJM67501.1 Uma2 family endonuclease [Acaryochloris sp. RU_4_1]NJN38892.1 Uma2 family endonuclease [Acaryochloridaceae cyanobacterium CSU_3_4]NJR56322.1 Uma2 family endonuclease [Acaryochloris sp. CRU_2_0]
MLQIDLQHLPSSDELLSSDDIPVDNEDQNFVPNILLFLLEYLWKNREDWFFSVDMGVYHTTGLNPRVPVVPDGFLSLGVERRKGSGSRNSYVVWEEQGVVPILTLEVVSQTPGGEYEEKLEIYTQLGVKYYMVYNPRFWRRDGHLPLEVYKLVDGIYQLQIGEPCWMPEIGLGIGRCVLPSDPLGREVLSWFDEQGDRYLTTEERAETERQRAETERQRAETAQQQVEALLARLRSLGISEEE